jgi:DeoR family ulaG and ulaABCDEF operon transcriptional repressor
MLESERHDLIRRVLRQSRFVRVADIVSLVGSSEATVRRDFSKLEQAGFLIRIRGGAEFGGGKYQPKSPIVQPSFECRKGILAEKKRLIARKAASLCSDGETIIIDGGSTTYQMAEFLESARLQIITNSFAIAEYLVKHSSNSVILNGGMIYPDSQLILDHFQEDTFKNYYAGKVFMGCYGIDDLGVTNTDMLLIKTEKAMIEHSKELIILADSSKFNRRGSLMLCAFAQIHAVITDRDIAPKQQELMRSKGINLIIA